MRFDTCYVSIEGEIDPTLKARLDFIESIPELREFLADVLPKEANITISQVYDTVSEIVIKYYDADTKEYREYNLTIAWLLKYLVERKPAFLKKRVESYDYHKKTYVTHYEQRENIPITFYSKPYPSKVKKVTKDNFIQILNQLGFDAKWFEGGSSWYTKKYFCIVDGNTFKLFKLQAGMFKNLNARAGVEFDIEKLLGFRSEGEFKN